MCKFSEQFEVFKQFKIKSVFFDNRDAEKLKIKLGLKSGAIKEVELSDITQTELKEALSQAYKLLGE